MASSGSDPRNLIRSVIDALRGTPRADSEVAEERNSETDLDLDQGNPSDQFSAMEEVTEHQEVRHVSRTDSGRAGNEIQVPFSLGLYGHTGNPSFVTDPRVPFAHDERIAFPPYL